jgi:uncharacterized membrane protein YccC
VKKPNLQKQYVRYSLRAGLAALIALVVAQLFHIEQNYWVLFGVITVTNVNVGASFRRGKERVLGTFMGVIVSIIFATFLLHYPIGALLLIPFFIFAAIYYIPYYAIFIFFVTMIFILYFGIGAQHPFLYAINRFIDTIIGVAIAMAVSLWIWPEPTSCELRKEMRFYLERLRVLGKCYTHAFTNDGMDIQCQRIYMNELDKIFAKVQSNLELISHEPGVKRLNSQARLELSLTLDRLSGLIGSLGYLALQSSKSGVFPLEISEHFERIYQGIDNLLATLLSSKDDNTNVEKIEEIQLEINKHINGIQQCLQEDCRDKKMIIKVSAYLQMTKDYFGELQALGNHFS